MNNNTLKEFREKFNYASFTWNGDNETGVKFAKKTMRKIGKFWLDKIQQAKEEEKNRIERMAHEMLPMLNTVKKDLRFWQGFRKGIELLIKELSNTK